jgi:hypothetical protein
MVMFDLLLSSARAVTPTSVNTTKQSKARAIIVPFIIVFSSVFFKTIVVS